MCKIQNCGCNIPTNPVICMSYTPDPSCEDRSLTTSNTTHPTGYEDITIITPEVNQISAYKEHLEFVNSPEPLSGIKKHTVLKIAQSFIDGITAGISNFLGRNVGTGTDIYKGATTIGPDTFQDFKRLKNSESIEFQGGTDDITAVVNEDWLQDQIPDIDYPVIDGESVESGGINLYRGLKDKKIQIGKLDISSNDIIVNIDENEESPTYGKVELKIPGVGSSVSYDLYLDANFVRPEGWELSSKWTLKTVTNPLLNGGNAIPVPYGTLNNPFVSWLEVLAYLYGNSGNKTYPEVLIPSLIVLNSFSTDLPLEYYGFNVEVKPNVNITYTGNRDYIFDNTDIFNTRVIDGGGSLQSPLFFSLKGGGKIIHTTVDKGIIKIITDETKTTYSNRVTFYLNSSLGGFNFPQTVNETDSNWQELTDEAGQPLYHGAIRVKGWQNKPKGLPLILLEGKNNGYPWILEAAGDKISFSFVDAPCIKAVDSSFTMSCLYEYVTINTFVSYSEKLSPLEGSNPFKTDILKGRERITGNASSQLFFHPVNDTCLVESDNSNCRIERLQGLSDAVLRSGVESYFLIKNNGLITIIEQLIDGGGCSAVNLIKSDNSSQAYCNAYNARVVTSKVNFLVRKDVLTPSVFYTLFFNSFITTLNNLIHPSSSNLTVDINTLGSFSFVNNLINSGIKDASIIDLPNESFGTVYRTTETAPTLKIK